MDRERWIKMNNTLQAEIQMADVIIRRQWNDTDRVGKTSSSGSGPGATTAAAVSTLTPEAALKRDQMLSEYMMATTRDKLVSFHESWKESLNQVCLRVEVVF